MVHPAKRTIRRITFLAAALAATVRAQAASAPASAPAAGADAPVVEVIGLTIPGRSEPAHYWLLRPPGHGPGERPPLIIALHGTDDAARDMIAFWSGLKARRPVVLAAPQGIGPGWRGDDVPAIRAMLDHLREHVSYDATRVLLAGFSAGGAMSFHLLYAESLPVTDVAALANYVPPRITREQIRARRDVPAFYAVGMDDLNHDRMHVGLQSLRAGGASVHLYRPRIGHVLEPAVGQAALDWFFDECGQRLSRRIEQAVTETDVERAAISLERIIAQARWHEPAHVAQASRTLEQLEDAGRRDLDEARKRANQNRMVDAVRLVRGVEATYRSSRLGREAYAMRAELEADPAARERLAAHRAERRAEEALAMYAGAQRLVARGELREARLRCRRIIDLYGGTPGADRALTLITLLDRSTSP